MLQQYLDDGKCLGNFGNMQTFFDAFVNPRCVNVNCPNQSRGRTYISLRNGESRPERDRIPIGPVTRHGGWQEDPPYAEYPRYVWKPSPDTEEVRQHLLSLLDSIFEHMLDDEYPTGNRLGDVVVWQLGEFRERRAVERLTELSEDRLGILVDAANEATPKY